MSYYRTINGKQYDRELLDIVEKAAKRTKAPLSKNIAKTLFDAIVDGGDYTDIEKRTVKHIRDNFKFSAEADEYLRTEIRKWAAKISVPSSKKKPIKKKQVSKPTKSSKLKSSDSTASSGSFYEDSYNDNDNNDDYEYNSPTPEYNELIALNKFKATPKPNPLRRIIIFILIFLVLAILVFFGIRSCNRTKKVDINSKKETSNSNSVNSKVKADTVSSSEQTDESISRSLDRVEIGSGIVSTKFETQKLAIRYINDLQIRFIKQSMEAETLASDKIATLAEALKSYPNIKVRIMGHTCFIGELDENKILSEERAKFIRDELLKLGVNPNQLDTRGFGETTSIGSNYTEAGRIQNRRVDFTVLTVQ